MNKYTYEQARSIIQDGDIVFLYGKKARPMQALIMFFTRSELFHVGVAFWVGEGENKRCLLIESHGGSRRRIVTLSAYDSHDMIVVVPPKTWDEVQQSAFRRIAKAKYGILEAGYIGIREMLLKYLDIKLPTLNFPNEVCSEFVSKLYDIDPPNISPQTLYEILMLDQKER